MVGDDVGEEVAGTGAGVGEEVTGTGAGVGGVSEEVTVVGADVGALVGEEVSARRRSIALVRVVSSVDAVATEQAV